MTTITIYSSKDCGVCTEVVPLIKKLARRKKIRVRVVDVDKCGEKCDYIKYVPYIMEDHHQLEVDELVEILKG